MSHLRAQYCLRLFSEVRAQGARLVSCTTVNSLCITMGWRETLPAGCPPAEAVVPNGDETLYRLVSQFPPTAADFDSASEMARKKGRSPLFPDACVACACSLDADIQFLRDLTKLPRHRRKKAIVRMNLNGASGVVGQTGGRPTHHSWWITAGFDAVSAAVLEVSL